jgi:hypothetical protein
MSPLVLPPNCPSRPWASRAGALFLSSQLESAYMQATFRGGRGGGGGGGGASSQSEGQSWPKSESHLECALSRMQRHRPGRKGRFERVFFKKRRSGRWSSHQRRNSSHTSWASGTLSSEQEGHRTSWSTRGAKNPKKTTNARAYFFRGWEAGRRFMARRSHFFLIAFWVPPYRLSPIEKRPKTQ